jgi:hypothetical protein
MTDIDRDEMEVLTRARRALSPTAADQQRVGHAVRASLALGHAPATIVSRLLTTCTVAVVAAGAGYWGGHRAGVRDARAISMSMSTSTSAEPTMPATSPTAPSVTVAPIAVAASAPSAPASGAAPALRHAHPGRTPAEAGAGPALSPTESLNQEMRVLRSVERALRDRQPGLAMALLRELERVVPGGKLAEERAATLTIARCMSGDIPLGIDLGDDFADRFPNSVYFSRVAQSCR